jgi:hypothetical protein
MSNMLHLNRLRHFQLPDSLVTNSGPLRDMNGVDLKLYTFLCYLSQRDSNGVGHTSGNCCRTTATAGILCRDVPHGGLECSNPKGRIDSMLCERTALSRKPEELARKELATLKRSGEVGPALVLKDPYILDFLDLGLAIPRVCTGKGGQCQVRPLTQHNSSVAIDGVSPGTFAQLNESTGDSRQFRRRRSRVSSISWLDRLSARSALLSALDEAGRLADDEFG